MLGLTIVDGKMKRNKPHFQHKQERNILVPPPLQTLHYVGQTQRELKLKHNVVGIQCLTHNRLILKFKRAYFNTLFVWPQKTNADLKLQKPYHIRRKKFLAKEVSAKRSFMVATRNNAYLKCPYPNKRKINHLA